MLYGRYGDTSGRPYIEGRLLLPRLQVIGDISFCIDTDADRTMLMPIDAVNLGVDHSTLTGDEPTYGISGLMRTFLEPAVLLFTESAKNIYAYFLDLLIAPLSPDLPGFSLLGRDVINQWRMDYNPAKDRLGIRVVSATVIVPLS